jgi:hypothetical protein
MPKALSFVLVVLVAGCPPSSQRREQKLEACARVGQTCEYSAGKLGTCVAKDGCTDASPSCFTCQSQH